MALIRVAHWTDLDPATWPWGHSSAKEMACRASGALVVDTGLMEALEALRAAVGRPLPVTSGYRSPAHNAAVSETGLAGPHTTGLAVDLGVSGDLAFAVVKAALILGFTGIGVSQRGPFEKRFVHLDRLTAGPRPAIWSY